jgi:hypothetical protein
VSARREFLKSAYTFLFAAACNPVSIFGEDRRWPLEFGSYVHCGWANPRPEFGIVPGVQCPTATPWALKTQDRQPALGYYDEREIGITKWRCQEMRRAGLDYAVYQVEWNHRLDKPAVLMAHCADAHEALLTRPYFCLSFFDVLTSSSDGASVFAAIPDRVSLERDIRNFARAVRFYTGSLSYYRVNGRPVLFWGYAHALSFYARYGATPRDVIRWLRSEIPDLYLVATCTEPFVHESLSSWGFDAFTEYLLYSDSWNGVLSAYRGRWAEGIDISKRTGIEYWMPATCGYNSAAWGSPVPLVFMPSPAEFADHLSETASFARANRIGRVITYAWSEFGEGGILEPMRPGMLHDGDEMLLAHQAAVRRAA